MSMESFNALMKEYVNKDYAELLDLANGAFGTMIGELKSGLGDNASKAMTIITAACFGVDAKLTALECKFINDLLDANWSLQELNEQLGGYDQAQIAQFTDELTDSLSKEGKACMVMFCLCLMAVDETITRDEAAFIYDLMA